MRVVSNEGNVRIASAQHTGKNASTITLTPGGNIQITPAATNAITMSTNVSYILAAQIQGDFGSASDPQYTFSGDDDTGFYRYTTNEIASAAGGGVGMLFDSNDRFHINGRYLYFGINSNDYLQHSTARTTSDSLRTPSRSSAWIASAPAVPSSLSTSPTTRRAPGSPRASTSSTTRTPACIPTAPTW